ncbi:sortase [Bifidobacterium actinocoloniiforme DSM 22766]|uniref:Sortase n=1 Tax=Bifidobacterium actinocoloniiforme DSM 22766 TaxID=1437605 RepID=A0A086YWD8_9BIFI|nr:class E sortase [Bifidobacterium actinocoloniiforme]AKV55788.1 sortase [Bifidobacterium actinocoloniiforme DSM 22766]KFI38588.1 sortase [Bifidobacterium actinocoloniiforme DSM 22766]
MNQDPSVTSRNLSRQSARERRQSGLSKAAGIAAEVLATLAVLCALYIAWQLWWTGVQSEHAQIQARQASSWSAPASGKGGAERIAPKQEGEPPVQPQSAQRGELIAQLYVPRFGTTWDRNVVEGTSADLLAYGGIGHYTQTQMPGQKGNFALAGHRAGYGEPFSSVDKLQEGDPIIVRTKDYWYVYHYTSKKVVEPGEVSVIAANPEHPDEAATKRMITLTTCEPKYATAAHRWISWGELNYWAKVSDGVPQELASKSNGGVVFENEHQGGALARLGSLLPVITVLLLMYIIIYLAALVAWRYPKLRAISDGREPKPYLSFYGWLSRHQAGITPVRWVLMALLALIAVCAMLEWVFPRMAANIPFMRAISNYPSV